MKLDVLEVPVPRLPPELAGLRIAHIADFHLGVPSPGTHAVERGVDWIAERRPDLVVLSGDLLAKARGAERLRALVERLPPAYAVLGNHDFGDTLDPFSEPVGEVDLGRGTLLLDQATKIELRGKRIQIVGVDPRSYMRRAARPWELADPDADLRILICHFPRVVDLLPEGVFELVLAGHTHDGQICLPYPGGKLRLAHPWMPYNRGLYQTPAGTLHVSPGLGTTFLPLRFFARPEATELVLHCG